MCKTFLFILCTCVAIASRSYAEDASPTRLSITSNVQTAIAFQQQVKALAERPVADEKTKGKAADEKVKKEAVRAGLARSNATPGDPFKIFKYRKNGTVVFADSAPTKTYYEVIVYNSCYACSLNSNVDWFNTRLHLTEFSDSIAEASRQYNVDQAFIRAIIHAESAFNPLARSRKGAMGLMQLMPNTAQDMGVRDASSPTQNIQGGVKYLAYLLEKFSGNETLVAAAYNAGPGAVTRHGGIPPYEETRTYVKRVKILVNRYKNQKILANN